ncbi:MAG TPA: hypothetical protein VHU80_08965 [Polyangiaceae bacterium]|nr:hypothetical protein [Polyangiaceae bacterium]
MALGHLDAVARLRSFPARERSPAARERSPAVRVQPSPAHRRSPVARDGPKKSKGPSSAAHERFIANNGDSKIVNDESIAVLFVSSGARDEPKRSDGRYTVVLDVLVVAFFRSTIVSGRSFAGKSRNDVARERSFANKSRGILALVRDDESSEPFIAARAPSTFASYRPNFAPE